MSEIRSGNKTISKFEYQIMIKSATEQINHFLSQASSRNYHYWWINTPQQERVERYYYVVIQRENWTIHELIYTLLTDSTVS